MGSGGVTGRGGSCWWNLKALGTFRISPLSPSLSFSLSLSPLLTDCMVEVRHHALCGLGAFFSSSHKMAEVLMLPS